MYVIIYLKQKNHVNYVFSKMEILNKISDVKNNKFINAINSFYDRNKIVYYSNKQYKMAFTSFEVLKDLQNNILKLDYNIIFEIEKIVQEHKLSNKANKALRQQKLKDL